LFDTCFSALNYFTLAWGVLLVEYVFKYIYSLAWLIWILSNIALQILIINRSNKAVFEQSISRKWWKWLRRILLILRLPSTAIIKRASICDINLIWWPRIPVTRRERIFHLIWCERMLKLHNISFIFELCNCKPWLTKSIERTLKWS
jgi:hypothetical protein